MSDNVRDGATGPGGGRGLAEEMAEMPGVWRRLLDAHVPDRLGRCEACRKSGGSGQRWPCSLHATATEARRLHELRLGRAIGE